jgi:hypothetical protein
MCIIADSTSAVNNVQQVTIQYTVAHCRLLSLITQQDICYPFFPGNGRIFDIRGNSLRPWIVRFPSHQI